MRPMSFLRSRVCALAAAALAGVAVAQDAAPDAADQDAAEPEDAVSLPETDMSVGRFLLTALPWIAGAAAVTGLAALALRKDEKKRPLLKDEPPSKAENE